MGNFENDFQDSYHDDPIEEISHSKWRSKFLTTGVLILGSIFFFQSTLASNISLNSGSGVEFGQGITQTVACSGSTDLILTPRSSFTNGSGSSGTHYFNSVTVSDIPDSCFGVDFTITAYDDTTSTPLALFNSTSNSVVVYDNGGAFSRGIGSTGMTVASSTGTFTATFTVPVAQSSAVYKFTIQSGAHTAYDIIPSYNAGDTGPGGGFIYYTDLSGFSCGGTYSPTGSPTGGLCHYLEVAPYGWNGGDDPAKVWAVGGNQSLDISEITNDANGAIPYNNALGVGLGYKNSIAIVTQNGVYNGSSINYAAGAARAYSGGSKNDWYLPTTAELNLLCQWDYGIARSVTTLCAGGTRNSATFGAGSAGISIAYYLSSSEQQWNFAWLQLLDSGRNQSVFGKGNAYSVRPIRAF